MSVISIQFKLIEMSNKIYVFKHFLNIGNVSDARLFTGNSFHSRGSAAPNAELPIQLSLGAVLAHIFGIGVRHAFMVEQVLPDKTEPNH